jgi:uncharacterized integral membrane protein
VVIVLSVIGGVLVVSVVGFGIFFALRKRNRFVKIIL